MTTSTFHDAPQRLAQAGSAAAAQLVRITALDAANRYQARPIEFDQGGATKFAGEETIIVTNLAEPADQNGKVAAGTDAIAVDVEGRWIIFIRPTAGAAMFLARVVAAEGWAVYTVREQAVGASGGLADKEDADDVLATSLAELPLGGTAVDVDTIVLVLAMPDGATTRYFFDHPVYAKYMD
jgi:hypothetical protein